MRKIIIFGLIVMLFFVACDKNSPIDSAASDAEQADEPVLKADDQPVVSTSDLSNKLKNIFSASVKYSVTYDITTKVGADSMSAVSSHYVDAPDKFRTDSTYQGIESRLYKLGDTITSCSNPGGSWTCTTLPQSESSEDKLLDDVRENVVDMEVTDLPDRRVAGTTAKCYQIKNSDLTSEYCFKDNIPIYVEVTASGMHVVQEATSYSKSVSSSDFQLPAQATEMPDVDIPEGVHIPGLS